MRFEPFSIERANDLIQNEDPFLSYQGEEILRVLRGSDLKTESIPTVLPLLSPQEQQDIKHPLTEKGGIFDDLAAWVAQSQTPDFGQLQKYCAQISEEEHPMVFQATQRICAMLDMPIPPIYVSWGEHSIGIRSHESPTPFVIIGGEHLKEKSPYRLSSLETIAILAMELSHLKNQNSRITSHELWQGLLAKGGFVLENALAILPLLKNLPQNWRSKMEAYNTMRSIIPQSWISQIYDNDIRTRLHMDNPKNELGLSVDPSTVLFAYRALQFNADRIALLSTHSLFQTIRSFFIGNPSLLPYKNTLSQTGIQGFYKADLPSSLVPIQENITLRAAVLISFYLSPQYRTIVEKMGTHTASTQTETI